MIFILFIVIEVVISYKCLTVKNYNIESDKIKENVKVVLVSDLHYGTFGENNKRLVSKIKDLGYHVITDGEFFLMEI